MAEPSPPPPNSPSWDFQASVPTPRSSCLTRPPLPTPFLLPQSQTQPRAGSCDSPFSTICRIPVPKAAMPLPLTHQENGFPHSLGDSAASRVWQREWPWWSQDTAWSLQHCPICIGPWAQGAPTQTLPSMGTGLDCFPWKGGTSYWVLLKQTNKKADLQP